MSMKNSNDTTRNRNRDSPACSAVPQPNAPPRAPRCCRSEVNPLNAELNPICHLLALLGAHHILHVSRIRVNSDVRSYGPVHVSVEIYTIILLLSWSQSNGEVCICVTY